MVRAMRYTAGAANRRHQPLAAIHPQQAGKMPHNEHVDQINAKAGTGKPFYQTDKLLILESLRRQVYFTSTKIATANRMEAS